MPNWGTGKWPKEKEHVSPTSRAGRWCRLHLLGAAGRRTHLSRNNPALGHSPDFQRRVFVFFFLSTRSAHTSSLSLQMQLDGERTEILIEVYDLRSGLILCQAASSVTPRLRISVYSFSHVSISPPDVGGMHQNSAAHLFSTSSCSSTLVSVSARRDHRARSAYGQKRKQLGRQASSLDFIISFSFFCCSAIHK